MDQIKVKDWEFKVKPGFVHALKLEYQNNIILPDYENIFKAYELTDLKNVKVVFLGQDPYPNASDAMGLSFSVPKDQKIPKSLVNIFKELEVDLRISRTNGDLSNWAKQGVLLLNTTLIVQAGISNSHQNFGFDKIIDQTFEFLKEKEEIVYILLGKNAQKFKSNIGSNNLIVEAPHPSPLSAYRGFFGSQIFSKTNNYLNEKKKKEIDWSK